MSSLLLFLFRGLVQPLYRYVHYVFVEVRDSFAGALLRKIFLIKSGARLRRSIVDGARAHRYLIRAELAVKSVVRVTRSELFPAFPLCFHIYFLLV